MVHCTCYLIFFFIHEGPPVSAPSSPWLRNLLMFFIIIQIAPSALKVLKTYYESFTNPKQKVGVITINNEICDSTSYVSSLNEFMEDTEIAAVVLKIDSPGGVPGASQALYDTVRLLKEQHKKPVVVWVQNVCASGAYYVASAGDWIISTPTAIIGSIGVIFKQFNLEKLRTQYNVEYNTVQAGTFKTTTDIFMRTTPAQTEMLQQAVDGIYARFIADVRLCRPQLTEDPKVWADARIFSGDEALKRKLVDEIGSQLTVEATVKRLAAISTDIEWVHPARKPSWMKWLGGDTAGDDSRPYVEMIADAICTRLGIAPQHTSLR
jgi:protease IV